MDDFMKTLNGFIKIILLLSLVTIGFANQEINAQDKTEITDRKPVLLLEEVSTLVPGGQDKTIWLLNSMEPNFVLYSDGLVIFKKDKNPFELFSVKLTKDEMNSLLARFNIGDDFIKLKDSYITSLQLEQPVYTIRYWQGPEMKRVKVFGWIRDREEDRNNTPQAFLKPFDQIIFFINHQNAQLWQPGKVEIGLYSYEDPQGEPVKWPKDWPDLNHKTTKKDEHHEFKYPYTSYTIYLDGKNKDELEQILSGLKEKQAVLINGKQWAVYPERYILPGEELWTKN